MINRNQFECLSHIAVNTEKYSQRQLSTALSLSLGTINKTVKELLALGAVDKNGITAKGLEMLEPYRVKRAVFIAAGFGSRMVPVTLNTPKPLVRVKGQRIIDSLLDAVTAAGIEEIIIVRGYLGEQFDQLLYKYPNIRFLENPSYGESNNISSALCARYLLKNAYLMEADLVLHNPGLITRYQYESNYLGVPVERTDDWCFTCKGNVIQKVSIGGTNCYHMFGISYWDEVNGGKLSEEIKETYDMPGGHERYWDQVPLEYFRKAHTVTVRPCTFDDITEIDTYNELKELDSTYNV